MQTHLILNESIRQFKDAGIKNPQLEAELLLSHTLRKPREYILAHGEERLTKSRVTRYELCVMKRLQGMPLAYITGRKEFYGLDFCVNKHVLVPRPETELMVEEALKHIAWNTKYGTRSTKHGTRNMEHGTIIDVGTGSGCIIITLAKILNLKSKILNLKFLATDISSSALTVARKNAKLHGVNNNIRFLRGNLFEPILKNPKHLKNHKNPIIVLANLPYLTPKQIKNSPTIEYEPKLALSAGPDGLKYYRELFKQIKNLWLSVSYPWLSVLAEIDPSQTEKIKKLAKTTLPDAQLQIKKDLLGHNRLVILTIRNS